MKKIFLTLNFIGFVLSSFGQSKLISEKGYSMSIPENWKPISKEKIRLLSAGEEKNIKSYISGYAEFDTLAEEVPYFVINYSEIQGSENALFKDVIKIQKEILERYFDSVNFVVDSNRYKFYTELKVADNNVFFGYTLSGKGIVYLNYYTDSLRIAKDKNTFLNIFNSIDPEYKFLNMNQHNEDARMYQKESGKYATYALVCLGMLGIIYFLRRLMK